MTPLPFGGGGGRRWWSGGPAAGNGRVEKNGTFRLDNLLPGEHYIRVTGGGVQGQGGAVDVEVLSVGGMTSPTTPSS